jgi:hypothetical protein
MKKVVIMFLMLGLVSCSNNDDGEAEDSLLNGQWTLTNISCFCGFPEEPNFEATQITFVSSENNIIVENSGEFEWFRTDGTYNYLGNGSRITLEDGRSYDFEISGNTLQLIFVDEPSIADDEVNFSFERN